MANYYTILGVSEQATTTEIKKAFRTLAKQYHPDLNPAPDAAEKFIELEVAYTCLSDSSARKKYDLLLKYKATGQPISNPRARKYRTQYSSQRKRSYQNARRHAHMSYTQYQREEFFLRSFYAKVINVSFTMILGAIMYLSLWIAMVYVDDPHSADDEATKRSIRALGFLYILVLIGATYIYEPLVKKWVIGKPKRTQKKA